MEEEGVLRFDSLPCKKFLYKKHFEKEKLFYFLDKSKIKYNRKYHLQLLENLEVAERQGSKVIFNNAGALFFSKNLKKIFFQTEIICGLFKGKDKGSLVLNNENYNVALRTLERDIGILKRHKFIFFAGHSKIGRYKVTEKYKKLKKSIK